jgi:predicted transposase YbfD/YdcC
MGKFGNVFHKLRDPRAANKQHPLLEILFIAIAAMLCGAKGPTDMAEFGLAKRELLEKFLLLENGVPSHDTFGRVFEALDPRVFEQCFRRFMAAFARFNRLDLTGVVAIDGKALRGAYERGQSATPIHMVNVFATQARMALASHKAAGRNEAQGALEVLRMLCLKHSTVTADALHCSRPFAKAVLERGADYVLALKQNQSKLFRLVVQRFARAGTRSSAEQLELSTHDRREWRRATVIRDTRLAISQDFPGIAALARVTSRRRQHGARADKPFIRYYLLSRYTPAKKLLQIVRSHWSIENQLHWILDVVFSEDANRVRKGNAPENLAILRKLALNIIRAHPEKISMRRKIIRAGWNNAFLLSLLSHMR